MDNLFSNFSRVGGFIVNLSNWRYDGFMLFGICQGHDKLADGTYIHTSPVVKMELCEEGLEAYTYSGTHYRMQANEVSLDVLEETKKGLELEKVDTSFLDDAVKQIEEVQKQNSPDCVNGKSFFFPFVENKTDGDDSMPTMEEWYNSLSDEDKEELDNLVGKEDKEDDFDVSDLSWKYVCHLTKWAFHTLLESGVKLKVTIKDGDLGCTDVQDVFAKEGYLILYKSGDNYMMDSEQNNENILCVDDFEYICTIVEKYKKIME